MSRSIWKNVYVDSSILCRLNVQKMATMVFQTTSRGSTILREFEGHLFKIYNGKQYYVIKINNLMFGRKLGEFVHTKKVYVYEKNKDIMGKYIKK